MRQPLTWLMMSATVGLIVAIGLIKPTPRLVWNASASAPLGLYWIAPVETPRLGDLLALRAPEKITRLMDERGYLPANALLLKRVVAFPGSKICREGERVMVSGQVIALAKRTDAQGRRLPVWSGCQRLADDEIFLVNAGVADSLDGRYFGPFPRNSVVGLARPIWTDDSSNGRR
jgi:conjugative transfer signal peptidase TraF